MKVRQDFFNLSIVSLFSQEVAAVFPYGEMAAAERELLAFLCRKHCFFAEIVVR